ncbi:FAD-binding oxidoreductase [Nocardioides guangzhouensis]|uniref:FAD-binding oxidoreductase n=1 Tax=Nocardioides guangzhouensis TaxID=2497878 RepID=A0A4Q4ZA20_9ACTN|nr:FAD-dependent oxidoreductase [Nocardioides guangzhouensis]RYP84448.1 FAD-binding oxidoreductase [Nocardioides guangzhouensis]
MSQRVAVIGAGMVGLSTAWFLQREGFSVTVYDRRHVAAGSSWGNAGWLTPALTAPLPEPAVLRYGVKAVLSPSSPVYVPLRPEPRLLRFLTGFARHSTARHWGLGMRAYAPLNRLALDAFDELTDAHVDEHTHPADPFLACFRTPQERAALLEELEQIQAAGLDVKYDVLTGYEARAAEPTLSPAIGSAVRLHDQRYLNPPVFLSALATAVRERGGHIVEGANIADVEHHRDGVRVAAHNVTTGAWETLGRFDAVVLANGAWLSSLARNVGVRQPVQAGRGYSFSVACDRVPAGPVYFPAQRVACTPLTTTAGARLRVAGMMEFRAPDAALDRRRITAIVEAARPLFTGVDLDRRHDEWVGSRPCTADGLPLIGATNAPGVFVAGGHGMWGVALGPLTGKLLAQRIATGTTPAELVPFDPLR